VKPCCDVCSEPGRELTAARRMLGAIALPTALALSGIPRRGSGERATRPSAFLLRRLRKLRRERTFVESEGPRPVEPDQPFVRGPQCRLDARAHLQLVRFRRDEQRAESGVVARALHRIVVRPGTRAVVLGSTAELSRDCGTYCSRISSRFERDGCFVYVGDAIQRSSGADLMVVGELAAGDRTGVGDVFAALVRWLAQLIDGLERRRVVRLRPRNLVWRSALVLFFDVTPDGVHVLGTPYLCVLDRVRHTTSVAPPLTRANVDLVLVLAPHRDHQEHKNRAKQDSRGNPHPGHNTPPPLAHPSPLHPILQRFVGQSCEALPHPPLVLLRERSEDRVGGEIQAVRDGAIGCGDGYEDRERQGPVRQAIELLLDFAGRPVFATAT
jgi:hypothetical protein